MVLRRGFKDNARDLEEYQDHWWHQELEYRGVLYFKLSESSIGLFLVFDYEAISNNRRSFPRCFQKTITAWEDIERPQLQASIPELRDRWRHSGVATLWGCQWVQIMVLLRRLTPKVLDSASETLTLCSEGSPATKDPSTFPYGIGTLGTAPIEI